MNYVLPEGFDFYGELNNHSDNDNLNLNEHSYDNKCLISGIELDTNKSITLNCGHSFDYIALLNDTQESKYGKSCKNNYNSMKLKDHQMRCPYCRQIQDNILPYFPNVMKKRMRGVNYPFSWGMGKKSCDYIFKTGKNKGECCNKKCYKDKCHIHYPKTVNDFEPNKVSRDPNELLKYTVYQLRCIAKYYKLKGYSKLKKNDLIKKIIDI
jgi:hypothetical protein